MSGNYKDIINAPQAQENPCVGISKADGYLSLRIEFRFKTGERKSYAYATLSETSYKEGVLSFQFHDTEIQVQGLALSSVMDAVSFHRVLWLCETDNALAIPEGEPCVERILLKKSQESN